MGQEDLEHKLQQYLQVSLLLEECKQMFMNIMELAWTAGTTRLPGGSTWQCGTAGILTAGLVNWWISWSPTAVNTTDTGFEYDGSSWTVAGAFVYVG